MAEYKEIPPTPIPSFEPDPGSLPNQNGIIRRFSIPQEKSKMTTTGPVLKEDAAIAQGYFDYTIGRLDRVLSLLVLWAKGDQLDEPNKQTLKHHAEDMIAAGQCILSKLGRVEATPQPSYNPFADEKGKQHQSPG